MTSLTALAGDVALPLATFLTDFGFWTNVGVLAGIYTLFTLGLQINVGFTGIINFGQAGFMAIGAYAVAILVTDYGWSFWAAIPVALVLAMIFGLLIGLPSLRLRADYFAIATIAAAEVVRITALNARDLTGGAQGIFGFAGEWQSLSRDMRDWLETIGWNNPDLLVPLLIVVWIVALLATLALHIVQRSPWGRVLRAVREDEDAARALGKNAFSYKLQSLAIAAMLGALAGVFLALNLAFVNPTSFLPLFTFLGYGMLVLGGLANYWGVLFGAIILQTIMEGTRHLPIESDQEDPVRFMVVGLLLILLMAFRPQGVFGKREEMVLGD